MWYWLEIREIKAARTRMKTLTTRERFLRPLTQDKQETYGVLMSLSDKTGWNRTPLGFDQAHPWIMPGLLGEPTVVVREMGTP